MTGPIGVLCGMKREAALLASPHVVSCSGGLPGQAEALAAALAAGGAVGLLSFGLAGGLAPDLAPGALLVGTMVEDGGRRYDADPAWSGALAARLPGARTGLVANSPVMVESPAAKARLHAGTGALGVDMESGAVARAAGQAGLPFAVLRAVADPAGRALPASALVGLAADGGQRPFRVAFALLGRPSDLPGLLALGRDARAAIAALERALSALGPGLAFQAA